MEPESEGDVADVERDRETGGFGQEQTPGFYS